eukprot:6196670-Pleurochrysis_carterae.AAC.3
MWQLQLSPGTSPLRVRAAGELGTYIALSGDRLEAADLMYTGTPRSLASGDFHLPSFRSLSLTRIHMSDLLQGVS